MDEDDGPRFDVRPVVVVIEDELGIRVSGVDEGHRTVLKTLVKDGGLIANGEDEDIWSFNDSGDK